MRLLIALLVLAFSLPVAAQDKKAAKKKADVPVVPAKAGTQKKAEKKPAKKVEKKEKTQAQPKQQEWGRFSSQAKQDEKARVEQKARK
jgi:hypothetical protein